MHMNNIHSLGRHREMSLAMTMPGGNAGEMMDVLTFAKARGVDHRTVRDWLAKDLLPGARKDARGKWFIPADAQRLERAAVERHEPEPEPEPVPPAFFTVAEAAELLGLSPYRVAQERDAFEVKPWGPNGALLVPAYVIRKYLGI